MPGLWEIVPCKGNTEGYNSYSPIYHLKSTPSLSLRKTGHIV